MPRAKDIIVRPIRGRVANRIVRSLHYSGKTCQGSVLHFGVFLEDRILGAVQFGSPIDRRKSLRLVEGTLWNEMLEINRMALDNELPRNSESRALGICLRLIKKKYPQIKWVLSFADGTQCGDGTIYRAAGFVLTGINRNKTIIRLPDGTIVADKTLNDQNEKNYSYWRKRGAKPLEGYQLRYVYFLDPSYRARLTVPEIPYSDIIEKGADMYLGEKREKQAMADTI